MTIEKSKAEFILMLKETETSESMLADDKKLMGDACIELRKAHGLQRNAVAQVMRMDSMQVAEIERCCSTDQAKQYRKAVLKLTP